MLSQTFIHLQGISLNTERAIWCQGICTHKDFLEQKQIKGILPKRKLFLDRQLRALPHPSQLPLSEHWRAYFSTNCCYLDIEIDRDGITMLCISDGEHSELFMRGRNLHKGLIEQTLGHFDTIVTFNGASFDLPRLNKEYGIDWQGFHIDLKTVTGRLGYYGGLKRIEKELGILRLLDHKIKNGDPALLYRMWRGSGDEHYLKLLVEYNEADAQNLAQLASILLPKMRSLVVDSLPA